MPKNKVDLGALFYRQKGRCYWCKGPMVLDGNGQYSATREHLVPQSEGGRAYIRRNKRTTRNIVAACKRCNNLRSNMSADEFRAALKAWNTPSPTPEGQSP